MFSREAMPRIQALVSLPGFYMLLPVIKCPPQPQLLKIHLYLSLSANNGPLDALNYSSEISGTSYLGSFDNEWLVSSRKGSDSKNACLFA